MDTATLATLAPRGPPTLPSTGIYTACYCEENIYLLCRSFSEIQSVSSSFDQFVMFISNHTKTVALWRQKLAKEEDDPVVWDYHVILVLRERKGEAEPPVKSWVYDFDSTLAMPCPLELYVIETFRPVNPVYESLFRVVPGSTFLEEFASDRSHMLVPAEEGLESSYSALPPTYPPIQGSGAISKSVSNNLMSLFVNMMVEAPLASYGTVSSVEGLLETFGSTSRGIVTSV
ncbi:hypothetical protein BDN72DRAFT_763693 [Pluteus cervinus]|uniref:Uncharacterized protein n=1 Tax=Pluteus cervinus TaxID=181527 RepID=A0ACD3B3J1_9AGAR|nr:hypothetical protein BDN72DRAFT_763693 [Pluteus cervinus]